MDITSAIKKRRSVRSYTDQKIDSRLKKELTAFIDRCNREGDLNMQLITDEAKAFSGIMAHYGKLKNVRNYIAIVCRKDGNYQERVGYYGEKVVLRAQQLGLNTCWVGLTYSKAKSSYRLEAGQQLYMVIAIGYGENQGAIRNSKKFSDVVKGCSEKDAPCWFKEGIKAALLAPTALNQQKFTFSLSGNKVSARAGLGFYSKVDLGIVKLHFEIAAGLENFEWK